MKKLAVVGLGLLGFVLSQMPSQCAQSLTWWTNLPPAVDTHGHSDWTDHPSNGKSTPPVVTNAPSVWTNLLHGATGRGSAWGSNQWWTNYAAFTNTSPPSRATDNRFGTIPPGQTPSATLPRDVQALLKQFQQQRNQVMSGLQNATDSQRQQILQQLEQVRDQLQSQLQSITTQAREQALDMRGQFGPHFAPGGSSGGGSTSSGHGGKPRD
jgi:hypothetical protein